MFIKMKKVVEHYKSLNEKNNEFTQVVHSNRATFNTIYKFILISERIEESFSIAAVVNLFKTCG